VDIVIDIVLAIIISTITYIKKSLTLIASIETGIFIFISIYYGGYKCFFILIISYSIIAFVNHLLKEKTLCITKSINKKSGPRDAIQVLANVLPAIIAIFLTAFYNEDFIIAFVTCISEALSDSLSSDIGVLSKNKPVSLFRFKRVEKGLSGGVSLLGSISCIGGIFSISILYLVFYHNFHGFLTVVIASLLGCFIDTFLGDLLQVKYICVVCGSKTEKLTHCDKKCKRYSGIPILDNCMVNLISNLLAGVFSVIFYVWIF